MIRFRTKKSGFGPMKNSLRRVRELSRDPVEIMFERLTRGLSGLIVDAFQKRYDPQRGARRWRRKVDGSPATLIRTGRMFRSLTRIQAWQLQGPRKMRFNPGRTAFYWRFHQEGTRTLPRRGMLPANRAVETLVQREFDRELEIRWR